MGFARSGEQEEDSGGIEGGAGGGFEILFGRRPIDPAMPHQQPDEGGGERVRWRRLSLSGSTRDFFPSIWISQRPIAHGHAEFERDRRPGMLSASGQFGKDQLQEQVDVGDVIHGTRPLIFLLVDHLAGGGLERFENRMIDRSMDDHLEVRPLNASARTRPSSAP